MLPILYGIIMPMADFCFEKVLENFDMLVNHAMKFHSIYE